MSKALTPEEINQLNALAQVACMLNNINATEQMKKVLEKMDAILAA